MTPTGLGDSEGISNLTNSRDGAPPEHRGRHVPDERVKGIGVGARAPFMARTLPVDEPVSNRIILVVAVAVVVVFVVVVIVVVVIVVVVVVVVVIKYRVFLSSLDGGGVTYIILFAAGGDNAAVNSQALKMREGGRLVSSTEEVRGDHDVFQVQLP